MYVCVCVCRITVFVLTINQFDRVGDIQFATGGQSPEESCSVVGVLETLCGLLGALTVVHLQVNDGPAEGEERSALLGQF